MTSIATLTVCLDYPCQLLLEIIKEEDQELAYSKLRHFQLQQTISARGHEILRFKTIANTLGVHGWPNTHDQQ